MPRTSSGQAGQPYDKVPNGTILSPSEGGLKNFKGKALFRKRVIIFEETVNCKFFKLDNTTSALGIIS